MAKDFGRRLPMDTKMISEIQRSPTMSREQGAGWLSEWGGPREYATMARWPVSDRLTFFAVREGYSTEADIAAAADLRTTDVRESVKRLEAKGYLEPGVVEGTAEKL